MPEIIFITGGQRSGKSNFAKQLAERKSSNPIFLATARAWDDDFEKRIKHHKDARGNNWRTIEEEKHLDKLNLEKDIVVLDCITLWLTNIFHDNKYHVENSLEEAKRIWDSFIRQDFTLLVVSNELGMGVHPESDIAMKFADLHGWINQHIASLSNEVWLMVSGIPLKVK